MKWVTREKLSDMSGYTKEAISQKRKKGIWREGIHCRKAPDGRILFNPQAIEQWIEGRV